MSIEATLASVASSVIANCTGMTTDNCKVSDESIFAFVQQNTSTSPQCCLVDFGGFTNAGKSEYKSSMISWKILVNGFFLMLNQDDYIEALQNARMFVDEMIQLASVNSTLGGTVLSFKIDSGTPPLSYRRGNYNYILVAVSASVVENIS